MAFKKETERKKESGHTTSPFGLVKMDEGGEKFGNVLPGQKMNTKNLLHNGFSSDSGIRHLTIAKISV